MVNLAVLVTHPGSTDATTLAQQLGLELVTAMQPHYDAYLLFASDGIALQLNPLHKMKAIRVEFLSGALAHRCQYGGGKNQLIAKAIGIKGKHFPTVIDATAGLGRDAFILAHLGCQVLMVERSAIIATLVNDGLKRARVNHNPAATNLDLVHADSSEYLNQLAPTAKPDVVYIDPMFPDEEKSALVKKEMRILRTIVGDDLDAEKLLDAALSVAQKRVVVKRSKSAPLLANKNPSYQLIGKSTRFDIYLTS